MAETQVCTGCGIAHPLDQFSWRSKKRGVRHTICKACHAVYRRQHYEANRARYIEKAKRWNRAHKGERHAEIRRFILGYLLEHPCVDCGEADPVVLEFDHVRGKKRAPISHMVRATVGIEAIKREIAKCDVRCANCHRRKTARERGYWLLDDLDKTEPIE